MGSFSSRVRHWIATNIQEEVTPDSRRPEENPADVSNMIDHQRLRLPWERVELMGVSRAEGYMCLWASFMIFIISVACECSSVEVLI